MYSVTVKIEAIESRRRSAGLLHVLVGFVFLMKAADYYRYLDYALPIPPLPFFAIGLLSLAYGFFRKRLDLLARYNFLLRLVQVIGFATLGLVMVRLEKTLDYSTLFVFALLTLLLLFSERRIFAETTIFFDEAGLRIPGGYKDHFVGWEELEDVVVREDFLTIFHIRKKYLQFTVLQDLSTLEVAKLNAFCKEQLAKHTVSTVSEKNS